MFSFYSFISTYIYTCMYMSLRYSGTPLYITDTFGEQCFGLYTYRGGLYIYIQRWPLLRGCFVHIWDLGVWPLYSTWPLFGGGC